DCWTLWHYDQPALGIPGAESVGKTLMIGHVGTLKRLYAVEETDAAGKAFVANVSRQLREIGWRGDARVGRLGVQDASDSHVHCRGEQLQRRFQAPREATEPLPEPAAASGTADPWPDPVPLSEVPAEVPFPLEVLPKVLQGFVRDAAAAFPRACARMSIRPDARKTSSFGQT